MRIAASTKVDLTNMPWWGRKATTRLFAAEFGSTWKDEGINDQLNFAYENFDSTTVSAVSIRSDGTVDPGVSFLTKGGVDSAVEYYAVATKAAPIPTQALLPGLIGIGAAALRKRKGEAAEAEA